MLAKEYYRNVFWKLILTSCICILVLVISSRSYGDNLYEYKKNAKLSNWLDKQGFVFGINKDEAMRLYKLQLAQGSYHRYVNNNMFHSGSSTIKGKGFIRAVFATSGGVETKTVREIDKCIDISQENLKDEQYQIEQSFKAKFNISPSSHIKINHKGHLLNIIVSVWTVARSNKLVDVSPGSAIVVSVYDNTDDVLSEDNVQKKRDKALGNALRSF